MYELLATVLLTCASADIEGSLDMLRVEVAQRRIPAQLYRYRTTRNVCRHEIFPIFAFHEFIIRKYNIYYSTACALASMQIKNVNNVGNILQP